MEDPDDRDRNGIRGRAARVTDAVTGLTRIGRFGWKAQHATLLAFSGDAYRNEMGITNDIFRDEDARGFTAEQLRLCSATRGIEDVRDKISGQRGIDNFTNFMRLLAPISRGPIDTDVQSGEAIFRGIGCASCHTPVLMTQIDPNPLFDRRAVPLFSDLLLHDVGTGDGSNRHRHSKERSVRLRCGVYAFAVHYSMTEARDSPRCNLATFRRSKRVMNQYLGFRWYNESNCSAFLNSL